MVRSLVALARLSRRSATFELVGAALIAAGVYLGAGLPWALGTLGGMALMKSLDIDLSSGEEQ